eukprot:31139-Prymnesium_polylepis.1
MADGLRVIGNQQLQYRCNYTDWHSNPVVHSSGGDARLGARQPDSTGVATFRTEKIFAKASLQGSNPFVSASVERGSPDS